MTPADVVKLIAEKDAKFADLRFTDTKGKEQHVSVPVKAFGEDKFKDAQDRLRIAFVCSMWTTGFDVPSETM